MRPESPKELAKPESPKELEDFYDYNEPQSSNSFIETITYIGVLAVIASICFIAWLIIH